MSESKYLVNFTGLNIEVGNRELINRANFSLPTLGKVALVGRNGSGKSTLLELIYRKWKKGELPEYASLSGDLKFDKNVVLEYFPQSLQIYFSGTVNDYILSTLKFGELIKRFERDNSKELTGEMNINEAWQYRANKETIVSRLGLEGLLNRSVNSISGGEAAKVALARILLSGANLLIMDEPTNNLDSTAVKFMTSWLKAFKGGLLLVSHDRDFLDEVVSRVIEIDEFTKEINEYGGNYTFYRNKTVEKFNAQMSAFHEELEKRNQLKKSASSLIDKSKNLEKESKSDFYKAKAAKIAKRAKTQLGRIKRELSDSKRPQKPKKPSLIVPEIENDNSLLISLDNVDFRYGDKSILNNIDFKIHGKDRLAIIGANGIGKTTLAKIVTGELQPVSDSGVYRKLGLRIGYLSQRVDDVLKSGDVWGYFEKQGVEMVKDEILKSIGHLLFRKVREDNLKDLSLGELQRVQLFGILAQNPQLLILDEPTNHLDLYTIELLEEMLDDYKGAVLIISHDRRFLINSKVKELYILENGQLQNIVVKNKYDIDNAFN